MPLLGSQEAGEGSIPTAAGSDSPGVTPPATVPTLAAVYAAGAAAPASDDLMVMTGAKATFQANSDASTLPYLGLWETDETQVVSNKPAAVTSLATQLSGLIGARFFNAYEMFDPLWNGTFQQLSTYAWQIEKVSFQNSPATQWRGGNSFGQRDYIATWNLPPEAQPTNPNLQQGSLVHQLFLYNTIDGNNQEVQEIDGWGQQRVGLNPPQHGITWAESTHLQFRLASGGTTNVGDGTGWAIFQSPFNHSGGDNKRGALWCKALDLLGNWQWSFAVNDGADNWLSVADFAKTGITFNVPVAYSPSINPSPLLQYKSVQVDFGALTSGSIVIIPAAPGFYAEVVLVDAFLQVGAGTATTNVLLSGGNNATQDNVIANTSAMTAALQNGAIAAGVPSKLAGFAVPSGTSAKQLVDLSTPATLRITQAGAGTGGYALQGYVRVTYTLHAS